MQLTFNFFLLSVALAYGGATALPVSEFPHVGRHEYEVRGDSTAEALYGQIMETRLKFKPSACTACYAARKKCDHGQPCSHCKGRQVECKPRKSKRLGRPPSLRYVPYPKTNPGHVENAYINNNMHPPALDSLQPNANHPYRAPVQHQTQASQSLPYVNSNMHSASQFYSLPGQQASYLAPSSNNVYSLPSDSQPQGPLTLHHPQHQTQASYPAPSSNNVYSLPSDSQPQGPLTLHHPQHQTQASYPAPSSNPSYYRHPRPQSHSSAVVSALRNWENDIV